jgi:hypothetical protein
MNKDRARLTVLMDAAKKQEFDALCTALGTNASEVLRDLIARYLARPGTGSSLLDPETEKTKPSARGK